MCCCILNWDISQTDGEDCCVLRKDLYVTLEVFAISDSHLMVGCFV